MTDKPQPQTTLTEEQAAVLRAILVEKARAAREQGNLELARFFMSRIEPNKLYITEDTLAAEI